MQVTGRDADQVRVEQNGDQITVVAPQRTGFLSGDSRLDVAVTVPTDSDLAVKTGSADITVDGTLGSGKVKSGSGDVQLDTLRRARPRRHRLGRHPARGGARRAADQERLRLGQPRQRGVGGRGVDRVR